MDRGRQPQWTNQHSRDGSSWWCTCQNKCLEPDTAELLHVNISPALLTKWTFCIFCAEARGRMILGRQASIKTSCRNKVLCRQMCELLNISDYFQSSTGHQDQHIGTTWLVLQGGVGGGEGVGGSKTKTLDHFIVLPSTRELRECVHVLGFQLWIEMCVWLNKSSVALNNWRMLYIVSLMHRIWTYGSGSGPLKGPSSSLSLWKDNKQSQTWFQPSYVTARSGAAAKSQLTPLPPDL